MDAESYTARYVILSRHSQSATRHDYIKLIPFAFTIKLPAPRYKRIIMRRNSQGRILRSVVPELDYSRIG